MLHSYGKIIKMTHEIGEVWEALVQSERILYPFQIVG